MPCPHCGGEHLDTAKFCPLTGKTLVAAPVACWRCQQPTPAGQAYCPHCGAPAKRPATSGRQPVYFIALALGLGLMAFSGWMLWRSLFPLIGPQADLTALPSTASILIGTTVSLEEPVTTQEPADTQPVPSSTPTAQPASTQASTATPTIPSTPTVPVQVEPLGLNNNPVDNAELVLIPAGPFIMGADSGSKYFWGAEAPEHQVSLAEYWIYRTEVTNAMYRACAAEKKCPRPAQIGSNTRSSYYEDAQFDDYPVIYVSWGDASAYCKWAGGRLPTEAEWEKAARGDDGRMFPWGNDPAKPNYANYGTQDTEPVGSYPEGASYYGGYDMAGNVLEWVFDYFQVTYYQVSPDENPHGPASGDRRVYRGGAWHNLDEALRSAARASARENYTGNDIGFRCVMDAK